MASSSWEPPLPELPALSGERGVNGHLLKVPGGTSTRRRCRTHPCPRAYLIRRWIAWDNLAGHRIWPRLLRVDPDELDKDAHPHPYSGRSPISSRRTQAGRRTPVLAVVNRQLSLDRRTSTTHRRKGLHVIAARAFHIEHAGARDGVGPDLINKPAGPQEPDERHDSRQLADPGGRPEKSKTLTVWACPRGLPGPCPRLRSPRGRVARAGPTQRSDPVARRVRSSLPQARWRHRRSSPDSLPGTPWTRSAGPAVRQCRVPRPVCVVTIPGRCAP